MIKRYSRPATKRCLFSAGTTGARRLGTPTAPSLLSAASIKACARCPVPTRNPHAALRCRSSAAGYYEATAEPSLCERALKHTCNAVPRAHREEETKVIPNTCMLVVLAAGERVHKVRGRFLLARGGMRSRLSLLHLEMVETNVVCKMNQYGNGALKAGVNAIANRHG